MSEDFSGARICQIGKSGKGASKGGGAVDRFIKWTGSAFLLQDKPLPIEDRNGRTTAHRRRQLAMARSPAGSAAGARSSLSWSCNSNASILGGGGVCDRSSRNRRRSPTSWQMARVWTSLKVQELWSGISHLRLARSWAIANVQGIKSDDVPRYVVKPEWSRYRHISLKREGDR